MDSACDPIDELASTPGLGAVLQHLGIGHNGPIGQGGEALVYALDTQRVVRVLRGPQDCDHIRDRQAIVDQLARGEPPFLLPQVLDCGTIEGRSYAIERRLPGRAADEQLARLDRRGRDRLIENHLDAANALGDLPLDHRAWFGDLLAPQPIRAETWSAYLTRRAATSLAHAPGFGSVDPAALAADLPDLADDPSPGPTGRKKQSPAAAEPGAFVHLDAFLGNMLATESTITAVIDIGASSIRGDRRLDPLSAAVYLCAQPITPGADDGDRRTAMSWLANAGLADLYEPARRWLAAFWAWAIDDHSLHRWCRSVLLD